MHDVLSVRPCVAALVGACRAIRQSYVAMPSIAEVLHDIVRAEAAWHLARNLLESGGLPLADADAAEPERRTVH